MTALEEIVTRFNAIPPAQGNRWAVDTIHPSRLHLSRGDNGVFAVVLEGALDTFGVVPPWSGLAHSDEVVALPSGAVIAALRISSQDPINGNRVIAHIAYELARQLDATPSIPNDILVANVAWLLPLLGTQDHILPPERQYGLLGECLLLHRLLGLASVMGINCRQVLGCWKGSSGAKRDFAGLGIAIEVKTTSHSTRLHHFASIEQLEPQSVTEEVFLFSVGVRRDQSALKKLPDYVADVELALVDQSGAPDMIAIDRFRAALEGYGYEQSYESYYRSQPGFSPPHLPAALYRQEDLERVRITSFKGDCLPRMVVGVGYTLEIGSAGLTGGDADRVLRRLVAASPL